MNEPRWFRLAAHPPPRTCARKWATRSRSTSRCARAELIEQGIDPERAREMAERRFGPVQPIEQELAGSVRRRRQREERAEAFMDVTQDVRFALRALRRAPGIHRRRHRHARPRRRRHARRVHRGQWRAAAPPALRQSIADPDDLDHEPERGGRGIRPAAQQRVLPRIIERQARSSRRWRPFAPGPMSLTADGSDESESLAGARVSPTLFSVLGVRPVVGQPFTQRSGSSR